MKRTIHLFFTFLLTSLGAIAQDFSVSVKANQVAPGRKIYLEFINGRGQAVKVDSLLPNAQKEVHI